MGSAISFALYELLRNPDIYEQVTREADALFANGDPTGAEFSKDAIDVSHRFIMETMRLHPVIPLQLRKAMNTIEIDGMEIPAGTMVALVGPTGAGKTSIANLIARFYDVSAGEILIDGVDIRDVAQRSMRAQMGLVSQDPFIFAGTIADNIRFGMPEATMDEVIAAGKMANVAEFADDLPHGYDTEIFEDGANLSVGQRQLISIARAILADPRILIMDEATSSVDMVIGVWLFAWLDDLQHLWFLWHLLWLVGIHALLVRLGLTFTHRWAWWALVPAVVVLQFFMLWIGADTSSGFVIAPHVLAYYALFFLFGAFVYGRGISLPKQWAIALLPALLLLYPLAVYGLRAAINEYDAGNEELAATIWLGGTVVQVAYTWLMCFGLMGLFRWLAATERPWVRYMSDSSYWLYLAHLPLIAVAQRWAIDWDASVHLKFALIVVASTAVLLASYHVVVRHTPIGTFLNGPRRRQEGQRAA
jgi:ABC-type phosphate transport system ATPase subunit